MAITAAKSTGHKAIGTDKEGWELQRFWSKVNKTDTCWIWTAYQDKNGYGRFRSGKIKVGAHRFSYELIKGPIPAGLTIDHLCRNPPCVNPAHLEAVTMKENVLRGIGPTAINARKTHCKHGHKFTPENTYTLKNGKCCLVCNRNTSSERYHAKILLETTA